MFAQIVMWLLVLVPYGFIVFVVIRSMIDDLTASRFHTGVFAIAISTGFLAYVSIPLVIKLSLYRSQRHDVAVLYSEGFAYHHAGTWTQVRWSEIVRVINERQRYEPPHWNEWLDLGDVVDLIRAYLRGDTTRFEITTRRARTIRPGETLAEIDDLMSIVVIRMQERIESAK